MGPGGWRINHDLECYREAKEALEHRIAVLDAHYRVLPIQVSPCGLQVRGAL